ncbi:STAS domain-containing protein [Streptomyces sp. NPDC085946]|uniref:STAS domain-containing protein n=1 Tax=Streptomyces sp. NPDC085946 TaxID=3365744 RepID=UPI0037D70BFB
MTELPSSEFRLSVDVAPPVLTVRVAGDLDYCTSGDLVDTVAGYLAREPGLRDVRLDFGELTWLDSTGLSALLMVHRHTTDAGAALHLDNRPDVLERMLRLTNVLDHLTGAGGGAPRQEDDQATGAGAT